MSKEELEKILKVGNILEFSDGCKFIINSNGNFADSISEKFPDDCFWFGNENEEGESFLNFKTLRIENADMNLEYDENKKYPIISSYFHGKLEKIHIPIQYDSFKIEGAENITNEEKIIMFDLNKDD